MPPTAIVKADSITRTPVGGDRELLAHLVEGVGMKGQILMHGMACKVRETLRQEYGLGSLRARREEEIGEPLLGTPTGSPCRIPKAA
jgi:hypothetical protein